MKNNSKTDFDSKFTDVPIDHYKYPIDSHNCGKQFVEYKIHLIILKNASNSLK